MNKIIFFLSVILALPLSVFAEDNSTRHERNFIVEGNKLYRNERFAEAEVAYRKALQENAMNEIAQFNLAASLLRQASNTGETLQEATGILQKLAANAQKEAIAESAFYNLGNIAFNAQDYAKSIELYKNALRKNPDNDKARENLRLAQKKLQDQQNDDNNNQDNKQDQDKQDQDKQDQNNQDQQNQDKNQDQDNKDNQDQQDRQQNQQEKQNEQQPQNRQNGGISQQNAEKILKAMENEENATRARINAEKKKTGAPSRRPVTNPW